MFERSIKSSQLRTRVEAFKVKGTGTAAIGEGKYRGTLTRGTLTDNGTGDYTITFTDNFDRAPICAVTSLTPTAVPHIDSATTSAVRIKTNTAAVAQSNANKTFNSALKIHSQLTGVDGNDITVSFVNAVSAGSEAIASVSDAGEIVINIESGVTTATQVHAALNRATESEKKASKTIQSAIKLHSQLNGVDGNDTSIALVDYPSTAAIATLSLTDDIVLTSVALGTARNTTTLTTEVEAAAANPTDTILAVVTGTADAIIITITPNDGSNNAATPVDLTTAELVELINTGAVVGKTVTVTDVGGLLNDQTATGGGADALANGGEGDSVTATFSGAVDAATTGTIASVSDAGAIVINIESGVTTATQLHACINADSVLANEVRNFISSEVLVGGTALTAFAASNLTGGQDAFDGTLAAEARNFISSEVLVGATAITAVGATNLANGAAVVPAAAIDADFHLVVIGFDAAQEY